MASHTIHQTMDETYSRTRYTLATKTSRACNHGAIVDYKLGNVKKLAISIQRHRRYVNPSRRVVVCISSRLKKGQRYRKAAQYWLKLACSIKTCKPGPRQYICSIEPDGKKMYVQNI